MCISHTPILYQLGDITLYVMKFFEDMQFATNIVLRSSVEMQILLSAICFAFNAVKLFWLFNLTYIYVRLETRQY